MDWRRSAPDHAPARASLSSVPPESSTLTRHARSGPAGDEEKIEIMKLGKTLRNAIGIGVSIVVLVAILAYMSGVFHPKVEPHEVAVKQPTPPPGATTDTVHAIVEMEKTSVVGTVRAERRTAVSSKIMATIEEITVSEGDKVQRSEVVVRLDDRDLQAKLEQARKAADAAQANFQRAEEDLKRFRALFEQKVIPRQQLDKAISEFRVAQAEQEKAEEAVNGAKVALSYAVIEAPTEGVVVDKRADEGDTATPGQPILSIYDPNALRLEAPVREALATQIKVGDQLTVHIDSLGLELEGRVDEIVPQARAETRTVLVKVAIPKRENLVEGMFGRLMIPTRQRQRYCVPLSAVQQVGQLRFVDVVTTDGTVQKRAVKLGEHSEFGRIEVISGLEDGETVLLHGPKPPPFPPEARIFQEDER
jgi:RND family efflux transporter MFP subunit